MPQQALNEEVIFQVARRIGPPDARAAYLNQVCGADRVLHDRVLALLGSLGVDTAFLEAPPSACLVEADAPMDQRFIESPGTQIGPYKLLQQIGEGGMGVVYMAEQTKPIARRVALKIIKPGMDSRQVIARFAAEKQALALMDHVNIARVLDANTTGDESGAVSPGTPYFVMELVHGDPITKYCDDNHLTPRQRLELFLPVCHAIQHAHQKGIIHRDIKPSNVMITLYDGKPVPKVIDFGVAKAMDQRLTEQTLFTQYGTIIGTLEYMSPEQAEMSALGVDTRSDIYSLGVLLYELLTGSTPLSRKQIREAAYGEILRLIREDEPPKPSTRLSDPCEALASISAQRHMEPAKLSKLMRGELDWIVMKTLEKDRNRRYETAKDFAADVQRYLNDEPIQARPITKPQRMWRWYRRHVPLVAGAYTVFTFAIIGIMGIAMTSIVQFLIRSPNAIDSLTALATFPVFVLLILLGVESGIAAFRGKRRGLWASLTAFGLIALISWWGLYWSIAISREISSSPVASYRVLRPDTFDGRGAYVRNCVIGYALLNVIWYSVGLVLQVHALLSRAADQHHGARIGN